MKKLLALLSALLLLLTPAFAESSQMTRTEVVRLLGAITSALDSLELTYEKDTEYDRCLFTIDMNTPSALGSCSYYTLYPDDDGVMLFVSYEAEIPASTHDELIKFCNYMNSWLHWGKFFVDTEYNWLCYDIFIPIDPANVSDFDREQISVFVATANNLLNAYQEYFLMVATGTETAANAYAMWQADYN